MNSPSCADPGMVRDNSAGRYNEMLPEAFLASVDDRQWQHRTYPANTFTKLSELKQLNLLPPAPG